jgi:coenzyme A diphosphatase NUDT7
MVRDHSEVMMRLDLLKDYKPRIIDSGTCKEFAVLIPMVRHDNKQCVAFQVRSGSLEKQPNQICFPGGKIEEKESPLQAAVRETCEEMLIEEAHIRILGETDTLVTPFDTIIYPFAGELQDYRGTFSQDEVQEVFYIPLDWLLAYEPSCSILNVSILPQEDFPFEKIQLGRNFPWASGSYPVYFYEYKDKVIWGITARILKNFVELISLLQ